MFGFVVEVVNGGIVLVVSIFKFNIIPLWNRMKKKYIFNKSIFFSILINVIIYVN